MLDLSLLHIPEELHEHTQLCHQQFQRLINDNHHNITFNEKEYNQLLKILSCSDFILQTTAKQSEWFIKSLEDNLFNHSPCIEDIQQTAIAIFSTSDNFNTLSKQLRLFRNQQLFHIAWRDIGGAALNETMLNLSQLADICIQHSLQWLHHNLKKDFGTAVDNDGQEMKMLVIAMGKLGAYELNFSSDIDLIFVFPGHGKTIGGKRCITHNEYFIKLGQQLIKLLNETTAYGFVFRVDMRLRPFGKSGPLAISIDAIEDYYAVHGREWERYALIKARTITGNTADQENLQQRLRPFIYRRYIDYSVFESLREMKEMISRQVKQKHLEHNIKLGAGGIREIEFLAQAFQLLRGGKETEFQQRKVQLIIPLLAQKQIISNSIAKDLIKAYQFLRNTEHRIQEVNDQQTHNLPVSPYSRTRLAFSMGFNHWEDFSAQLKVHRTAIQDNFLQLFQTPAANSLQAHLELHNLDILWLEYLEQIDNVEVNTTIEASNKAIKILKKSGFNNENDMLKLLLSFRQSSSYRKMTSNARGRLNQLMPIVLNILAKNNSNQVSTINHYNTLKRLLAIFESTCRRSVYLSLLIENPMALSQLIKLCAASIWISKELTKTPALLDELLNPQILYSPLNFNDLIADFQLRMENIAIDDVEQQMEILRQFKLTHVLRVAAADITGSIELMQVSDYLSWIAEAILQQVINIAWFDTIKKLKKSELNIDNKAQVEQDISYASPGNGFAIIAYGKFGGYELGYASDLDLVFVFDDNLENKTHFFTRLCHRIMFILGTRTYSGLLYECDMRLRPNGNSGQIVTSLKAFKKYQLEKAWLWEHQALCRARVVAGDNALIEQFSKIRQQILCQPRERQNLQKWIIEMRKKMHQSLAKKQTGMFDIKQSIGGMIDIEFIVQYLILLHAREYPEIVEFSDNIRLINSLQNKKIITPEIENNLAEIYKLYRTCIHHQSLQELPPITTIDTFFKEQQLIKQYWEKILCN